MQHYQTVYLVRKIGFYYGHSNKSNFMDKWITHLHTNSNLYINITINSFL